MSDLAQALKEIDLLKGTLRYIGAQAKAGHPGVLNVIVANVEAALSETHASMIDAIAERERR